MTFDEFISRAIRVPFMDKGRDWESWDCWGMCYVFHRDVLAVDIPSYTECYLDAGRGAESRARLGSLISVNLDAWERVDPPPPGSVALLLIGGKPIHVGLTIGDGLMLHTERRINTIIERLASPMWARRIEGFYRAR